MLSFKQILQSYDKKSQSQSEGVADQESFLFSKLMKMKNKDQNDHNCFIKGKSQGSKNNDKGLCNMLKNYLPSSISSYNQNSESFQYSQWMNSMNQDNPNYNCVIHSVKNNSTIEGYQSEIQMYKLQKANLIADIYLQSNQSMQQITQQVLRNISEEIYQIISNEQINQNKSNMRTMKKSQNLQSTLGSPYSNNKNNQDSHCQQGLSSNGLKPSPPPKIIQFTLGNHNNSSTGNKKQYNQNPYNGDVSQFFGGKLNGPISKQIKNRVMGAPKQF